MVATLNWIYERGRKPNLIAELEELINGKQEPTDEQLVKAVVETNTRIIVDGKGTGLLILLDELGKFFEYATLNPQRQDVFLLQRLIAVPKPLGSLVSLVQEVQRWEWIAKHVAELSGDKYAREEVSRQSTDARNQLERRIQSLIGLTKFSGAFTLDWFHKANTVRIRDGRHLLSKLSEICDET